jgi:hypothetical protein
MWYEAVVLCGLSGPLPCIVQHRAPHVTRNQCLGAIHRTLKDHGLPSGAVGFVIAPSWRAAQRNPGAAPFFNAGCVAQADEESIMRALGPKSGAEL